MLLFCAAHLRKVAMGHVIVRIPDIRYSRPWAGNNLTFPNFNIH